MNQHLKFGILFAFIGVFTFLSCFYGGGATVSFMLFGNIYKLALLASLFAVTLAVISYIASVFWAPIALDLVIEISQEIWKDIRKGQAEKKAKEAAEKKKRENGG